MNQDIKLRIAGLVSIGLGAVLAWFFVLAPLRAAQAGAPEITYYTKALILAAFCLVFGLAFLLFGQRFNYRDVQKKSLTRAGWVMFAIGSAVAAAGWWWFEQQFSALGYA